MKLPFYVKVLPPSGYAITIPLIVLRSARQESHTLVLVFTCIVQRKRMWSCGEDLSSADQQSNQARGDSESYGRTSVE